MKAYSVDLRERVVRAVHNGQPVSVAARVFSVSRATAERWVRRIAGGEPLGPSRHLGPPRRIGPSAEAALEAQLRAHPDALLAALTPRGLSAPMTRPGAVDTVAFTASVAPVLGPTLTPGQIVVMDNL